MVKVAIQELTCLRCGHTWVPRRTVVKICPVCKRSNWDVAKDQIRVFMNKPGRKKKLIT